MSRKASMELSVNSIVILVIAVVMMGLILGFIRAKFVEMGQKVTDTEPNPPAASLNDPLTVSSEQKIVSAGATSILKVNVYNINTTASVTNIMVNGSCGTTPNSPYFGPASGGKTIGIGQTGLFSLNILTTKSTLRGTYLCTIITKSSIVTPITPLIEPFNTYTPPTKDISIEVQ